MPHWSDVLCNNGQYLWYGTLTEAIYRGDLLSFHLHGVRFASNTSALALATWCGTVVASTEVYLRPGTQETVQLSPVQGANLIVSFPFKIPAGVPSKPDLQLQYLDQSITLKPTLSSKNESQWKV